MCKDWTEMILTEKKASRIIAMNQKAINLLLLFFNIQFSPRKERKEAVTTAAL